MAPRRSLTPAALLARRTREHAVPGRGVSSEFVNNFLTAVCGDGFKGVASIDQLPRMRAALAPRLRYRLVINLGDRMSASPDGHFVVVEGTPSAVRYTDPFGLPPPPEPRLLAFLEAGGRPIRVSRVQMQDFRSVYCGFFAILLVWHGDAGRPFPLRLPRRRRRGGDLRGNDKWCMRNLRRLLRTI